MGLISLAVGALGAGYQGLTGTLASSMYKEYFESGDMSDGVLMKRAQKIVTGNSKNTVADNNLISNGSVIDVQTNQCMIIVDSGKIVDICTEPGQYKFDQSTAPGLFAGKGVNANNGRTFWQEIGQQWLAGGQRSTTQRVYFINMGELIGSPIKWGNGNIAFHHCQVYRGSNSILEMDMTLKANGEATLKITDPVLFFTQIGSQWTGHDGNSVIKLTDENIYSNLKSGIVDNVSTAISALGENPDKPIAYTSIKAHSAEIKDYLNKAIENDWGAKRGFIVENITINGSPIPTEENKEQLEQMQQSFNMAQNANAMNYDIQKGYSRGAEAMGKGFQAAGENGTFSQAATTGMFMGGMMGGMGAGFGNIQNQNPQQQQQTQQWQPNPPAQQTMQAAAPAADSWTCGCGKVNAGDSMFCTSCGSKKPDASGAQQPSGATWTCSCGKVNSYDSLFCPACGSKKPVVKKYRCDKCGWEPAPGEGENTKFCPKCGDPFNDADVVEE